MKRLFTAFKISSFILLAVVTSMIAQSQTRQFSNSATSFQKKGQPDFVGKKYEKQAVLSRKGINSPSVINNNHTGKQVGETVTDTLHFPLSGDTAIYTSELNGFVTGNNEYGDLAKADFFQSNTEYQISGILFGFAYAVGGNPSLEVAVWDNTGTDNSPGVKKGSVYTNLNTIKTDIGNNHMTYVAFNPPLTLTTSFYAGIILPTSTGDTLAIWSNTDGDTNPGISWEMWNTGDWYPMSSNAAWGLDIGQAIFPVINYEYILTADFSADDVNPEAGQTISFTDLSIGVPITWNWTFEGGNPVTSNQQNPKVVYNSFGNFDVTLIVGNGIETDTVLKQSFISVEASTVQTDTLNYPLAGTYAVYGTPGNGFVTGNNEYGDLAKANFYFNNQSRYITGILFEFAYATGGNPNIEIDIWSNAGTGGSPGSKIAGKTVPLNTIKANINNEAMTFVALDSPLNINTSYYAGFKLPTTTGDTLVVWSNSDGDTNPGIAWEMWDTGLWYSFSDTTNWGLNLAMAIYPIVQNSMGLSDNDPLKSVNVFPNPSQGIFLINLGCNSSDEVIISVFSVDGSQILVKNFNREDNMILDLSNNKPGIYMAHINTGKQVYFQKLILNGR
jgi:hypothetical protein